MNYLAHLFLADNNAHSLLGNLMGDFVKGNVKGKYPSTISNGILMHREVDKFTDSHSVVELSKKRVNTERRRYAGILVDVFYDHFLAINWHQYSKISLDEQIDEWMCTIGESEFDLIPERMLVVLDKIKNQRLLQSYQTENGIALILERISGRIRFQNDLADGIQDFKSCYEQLNDDFNVFFPELLEHVKTFNPVRFD